MIALYANSGQQSGNGTLAILGIMAVALVIGLINSGKGKD